ncbi:MAG TPA: PLD nuclease N-terminal domain-containing protein [Streptosporangiaceae bacterium]|nr:PLD nuclease N-terminal domain-containing protein [Streptosporangiaceae bacterium]
MLLVGVLFGLVTVGFVVPCLIDVAVTPRYDVRSLTKSAWAAIIVCFSVFGATAWLVAGRPDRRSRLEFPRNLLDGPTFSQQDALRRHPAGRAMDPGIEASGRGAAATTEAAQRPMGPDDDEDFLQELTRRIRDARDEDGL